MKGASKKTQFEEEVLSLRRIDTMYPSREAFKKALHSGRRLTVYMGIDPTSSSLHIGHSVGLFVARALQELGHRIIILIGDFTGQVGDPTGRFSARSVITHKEALKNAATYKKQIRRLIRFDGKNPATIKFNSAWLSKFTLSDLLEVAKHFTSNQMLKRDMFQKRITQGKEIYLNEFLYPLMQGYDSVALNTDVEIGGSDQTFNMLVGRDLVKTYKNKEKFVITTHLLINPKTGAKLSKSEGSLVSLDDSPKEMYGKIMALPDEAIHACFLLCTAVPEETIKKIERTLGPKEQKSYLARELVALYYGIKGADKAASEFSKVFSKKGVPQAIKTIKAGKTKALDIVDLLVLAKAAASKSNARRLIIQGAVDVDGIPIKDWKEKIAVDRARVFKVGKHTFFKVEP